MMRWKSEQYRRTGATDVFRIGWVVSLLERILERPTKTFRGVLSTLRAGDQVLAVHMGMRSLDRWHYWFPAYAAEHARFSPGRILLMEMAARAESLGIRVIDLGKGAASYKERFANDSIAIAEGAVQRRSVAATGRTVRCAAENICARLPATGIGQLPGRLLRRVRRARRFV